MCPFKSLLGKGAHKSNSDGRRVWMCLQHSKLVLCGFHSNLQITKGIRVTESDGKEHGKSNRSLDDTGGGTGIVLIWPGIGEIRTRTATPQSTIQ